MGGRAHRGILSGALPPLALLAGLLAAPVAASAPPEPRAFPRIAILAYHDVSEVPGRRETVTPARLRADLEALERGGWTVLSLDDLWAARERPETLPPRVAVLTFDDGYRSFVAHALPLLEERGLPATLAFVTSFVERPPPDLPPLLDRAQAAAVAASGRVEVACHTHDLHRWEVGNPWRDTWPSVTTRLYHPNDARYETRDEYHERVRRDLDRSRAKLTEWTGKPPLTLVWPYGEHNAAAEAIARDLGFARTLALGDREVGREDLARGCLPRFLVTRDMALSPDGPLVAAPRPMRAAQVDLDALHHADPLEFRRRVERMVEQVEAVSATHVFLQACPDPDGDGRLDAAWFMNHQTRIAADVWSMVAAKLTHAGIQVWIRAPSMNFSWAWASRPEWRMPFAPHPADRGRTPWYYRLSPELEETRRLAIDFYTDLAVYLPIRGVLFDDDAYALAGERLASGASSAAAKDAAIRALHDDIRRAVLAWRPECRFARNLYAPVVERGGVHPGFAQHYERALESYDVAVVMAYARMEGHLQDGARWTRSLARRAVRRWERHRGRASRAEHPPVLFKVQAYDWKTEAWVPGEELLDQARAARRAGVSHLGVYPVLPEAELPARLLEGRAEPLSGEAPSGR